MGMAAVEHGWSRSGASWLAPDRGASLGGHRGQNRAVTAYFRDVAKFVKLAAGGLNWGVLPYSPTPARAAYGHLWASA